MSSDTGLWAFDLCKVYPLPENRVMVRNPRNGKHAVLTPDVYQALLDCRVFRTLDGHARHLATHNPQLAGQEQAISEVLDSVRRDGLLLSAGIYPHLIGQNPAPRAQDDKAVAAVITWERPEALARCLDSVAANCGLDCLERFFVIDDSRSEEVQAANRKSTETFAKDAPVPAHYVGAREQRQFMERIVRQVPAQADAVRFLIDRERWAPYWTSGLGRTVALMLSVGRRLLVLDDDILCEVYEPFSEAGTVSFSDQGREAAFYRGNDEWRDLRAPRDTDPFERHLQLLGQRLPDALGTLGVAELGTDHFAAAPLEFLEKLRADSPVLVTECGSLGDPGTSASNWLSGLTGASRERLLSSSETVENALKIRNCWIGRSRAHIGPRSNMSQLTGLDNRYLLPPYIPILRGEDRLFGSMVEFVYPTSVVVDNAWALPHLPIPERRWTAEDRSFDTRQPFPQFILSMVSEHTRASNSTDPMRRLGHLARLWEDLADLDHAHLRDHYLDKRLETMAHDFNHLKATRAASEGAPRAWLDYLDEALDRLNQALIDNPVEATLRGYPDRLENERLTVWWREFFGQFAHAIRSWPAIRQAARKNLPKAR